MSLFEDFRSDLTPATAAKRLEYFSVLKAGVEAARIFRDAQGPCADKRQANESVERYLAWLLDSHIRFAKAQVDAERKNMPETAAARDVAAGTVAPPLEDTVQPPSSVSTGTRIHHGDPDRALNEQALRMECLKLAVGSYEPINGQPPSAAAAVEVANALTRFVLDGSNA